MRALAVYGDPKAVDRVHHRAAVVVHKDADRHTAGADVIGKRRVHAVQDAVCDHILRTLESLLRGLEHKADPARKFLLRLLEQLCRRQQHRRVKIMAAGVRLGAGRTGEGLSALLLHRQRVHIRAQQQRPAALLPQLRRNAVAAGPRLQPGTLELLYHIGLRLWRLQADLGMGVHPAAVRDRFVPQRQGAFVIIHIISPSFDPWRLSAFVYGVCLRSARSVRCRPISRAYISPSGRPRERFASNPSGYLFFSLAIFA